jgi:pimeloyl-ACP methyl ester carboxylesterase
MTTTQYLKSDNKKLGYVKTEGRSPGVIFIHGFRSDMSGEKALALEAFCKARGQQFIRFDCTGHGASSGEFADGTISSWKDDLLDILKRITDTPQVLVGSSMGGWLALLAALEMPEKVSGIIGIAAAPDFTERMVLERMTEEQCEELYKNGVIHVPSDMGGTYPITLKLIGDGQKHLLLHDAIDIDCPVHLLQGMKDDVVPWEIALGINEKLKSKDVKCTLIEDGDHRLSTPENIAAITRTLDKMLKRFD